MILAQKGQITLVIAPDHPAFSGHFPDMPIVPGVVLLDEALYAMSNAIGTDLSTCTISAVKFLSPLTPGESVLVNYAISINRTIRFDIVNHDRTIATGTLRIPDQSC